MKILMVCLGNICRSPLAEGIMQSKIGANNLNWEVDSAGTGAWHVGEAPDSRSVVVAQKNNIDVTQQKARQFKARDLDNFDLILAMDISNYQNIIKLATNKSQKDKVKMIMNYVEPGRNVNVPDPYYGQDGFEQVYHMLDLACESIIKQA